MGTATATKQRTRTAASSPVRDSREVLIHLHQPHAKQAAFLHSPARRKCIVAGRRGGKTTGVADLAVEAALRGRRVLEAAPTADQTAAFWDACKRALNDALIGGYIRKNETERLLTFPGGGRIRTKTAWDADSLRGDYADLLILDEYSLMSPDAWDQVGAPMLLDNDGDAVFIFTPQRRNHAFALYQRAVQDETGRWAAFHFTSYDNPYLSRAALAEITRDMTEDGYRQEILAEFLESAGAVFRNLGACLGAPLHTTPEEHAGHELVAGVDWGMQDFTAISVVCRTCRCEVARDRFHQIDYALQRARLGTLHARWQIGQIVAEQNAAGVPIIEQLQRDDLPVTPFLTTASSKPPLIESLVLAFERVEGQWQADDLWKGELESYERRVNPQTNRATYTAPAGMHDDTVIARALAWHAVLAGASSGAVEVILPDPYWTSLGSDREY